MKNEKKPKDIVEMRGVMMKIVTRLWNEFPNFDRTIGYNPTMVKKVRRIYITALKDVIRIAEAEVKTEGGNDGDQTTKG